jgi:hypothetical protein
MFLLQATIGLAMTEAFPALMYRFSESLKCARSFRSSPFFHASIWSSWTDDRATQTTHELPSGATLLESLPSTCSSASSNGTYFTRGYGLCTLYTSLALARLVSSITGRYLILSPVRLSAYGLGDHETVLNTLHQRISLVASVGHTRHCYTRRSGGFGLRGSWSCFDIADC